MTDSVKLNYALPATDVKPPLDTSVRLRLSVMMFLEFAVWGSWFTVFNVYCDKKLHFSGAQIGSLYGTMALGAILSMTLAGQIADRFISSEYIMVGSHLLGAGLLLAMSQITSFNALWWTALGYALVYNPTLAVANSISFANIPDATRDFPTLRVLGTLGWIAAGLSVDRILPHRYYQGILVPASQTNLPLVMAAVLSAALGVFCVVLPHTPPSRKHGDAVPFLCAFALLRDPSFGVFFAISFIITIALAFYYGFAGVFLDDIGVKQIATTMIIGQCSELFFMMLLGVALMKFGMKWVLGIGMAAWAVRYGLFSLGHPFVLIVIGVALHGVCFDFFLAAGFIHTDKKAPESIRGSAQGLFSFLTYGVGMWIGNMISGRIVDHYTVAQVKHWANRPDTVELVKHWSNIWLVPALGAAACLILFMLLWRDTPGKLEEGPVKEARGFEPIIAGTGDLGSVGPIP